MGRSKPRGDSRWRITLSWSYRRPRAAAEGIGVPLEVLPVRDDADAVAAVSDLAQKRRLDALLVSNGSFFYAPRSLIISLAANHAVPNGELT